MNDFLVLRILSCNVILFIQIDVFVIPRSGTKPKDTGGGKMSSNAAAAPIEATTTIAPLLIADRRGEDPGLQGCFDISIDN